MSPADYKALRDKLGLTQAGLAARLGVSRKTVNARETGATRITEESALAIQALTGTALAQSSPPAKRPNISAAAT